MTRILFVLLLAFGCGDDDGGGGGAIDASGGGGGDAFESTCGEPGDTGNSVNS